jgi:8-oxo-dGTP pyrophosphatase MutT (NUDIX family)
MTRPRHASTIVLIRPNASDRFEILLTRRLRQMRFMGGFYVFPGGAVHDSDYSAKVLARCRGLSAEDARAILGGRHEPEIALGHWVAAIRELFEEVGILLCVTEAGEEVNTRNEELKARLEVKRRLMIREQLDFGAFLETERLYCDLSRQAYFFHRVTPELYPIRLGESNLAVAVPA